MKVKNIKLLTRNLLYVLPERKKTSQKQSVALFTHRPLNYDFILIAPDFVPNSCMVT